MSRRAVALAVLFLAWSPGVAAAEDAAPPVAAVGAPLPVYAPGRGSLLTPATLEGAFRIPRADTALYVGTSWYVRDLTVTVVGPGARRDTIVATTGVPGAMLGLRLPPDAWQADRVELRATSVSAVSPPVLLTADQLAQLAARNVWYATTFGVFVALALLFGVLAVLTRSRLAGWYAATAAAQAGLLIPWLGVVRPPPAFSQPLHAVLQALAFATLAAFVLAYARGAVLSRYTRATLWTLVALNAAVVAGDDILQDLWPLSYAIAQTLLSLLTLAYIGVAAIAVRQRVLGASWTLAGTALAAAAVAITLSAPSGALRQLGPLACNAAAALLFALAVGIRLRGAHGGARSAADGLTGIANRAALDEAFAAAAERARVSGTSLAVLLIDIDHFKAYNDTYGHHAGDDVLRRVAAAVAETATRRDDVAGRYGGEEFLVILPASDADAARTSAETLRSAIGALEIAHGGVPSKRLSVSIGVAALIPQRRGDGGELVRRAADALHVAKTMGRNRVVIDEPLLVGGEPSVSPR